jgi:cell division protein FtsI (penicillin-binding protein 3)
MRIPASRYTAASLRPAAGPSDRDGRGRTRPQLPGTTFARRSLVAMTVYVLVALALVGKLVSIQVVHADTYAAQSEVQRDKFLTLAADRGRIYDRHGDVLAVSVSTASVWADPRAFRNGVDIRGNPAAPIQDLEAAVAALAPVLDVSESTLRQTLQAPNDFVWLTRQSDPAVGDAVRSLQLQGVGIQAEPRRTYPGGALAGQVIGTTDIDGLGLGGMELRYDSLLVGQPGWMSFERGGDGALIPSAGREMQAAVSGSDLVLTVDRQLQHVAEQVAIETVAATNAIGASVVVLEVGTGDVLAMASAPVADINTRATLDSDMLRNRAVTDNFEPGSVQKALTAAAAIEEGLVTPDTVMRVPDNITVGGKRFTDSHEHPVENMTFTRVIGTSSNVGTIMVARQLGEERLADWIDRFGYGKPTGVGFPGEASGLVRPVGEWWGTSLPTVAIGQGVAVTLIQAANAYATLANDGVAVQPRLVRGTVDANGILQPVAAVAVSRVVSAETALQVRTMLASAVSGEDGTGSMAAVAGYDVAGKTGTARKPRSDGRGYSGKYIATFVGMAPADSPKIVVAVMVDEPTPIYGGIVAAPAFSKVMEAALRRSNVPASGSAGTLSDAFRQAREAAAVAEDAGTPRP